MQRARGLASALAGLLFLVGCAREVFEHTRAPQGDAGPDRGPDSGLSEVDCRTAQPGARCDDDNACTPASSCRDGACQAGTTSRECMLASTADRAEDMQGDDGWYYGYWNVDEDADGDYDPASDFEPMEYCEDGNWRPPGVCSLTRDDEGFRWTSVLSHSLQHPETAPDLELPVRRWVSPVAGPARLEVRHSVGGEFGDGTRAILVVDGDELWRNDATAGDVEGTTASLEVQLRVGTVIDQLVHPIDSSSDDTTFFELRVEGR